MKLLDTLGICIPAIALCPYDILHMLGKRIILAAAAIYLCAVGCVLWPSSSSAKDPADSTRAALLSTDMPLGGPRTPGNLRLLGGAAAVFAALSAATYLARRL